MRRTPPVLALLALAALAAGCGSDDAPAASTPPPSLPATSTPVASAPAAPSPAVSSPSVSSPPMPSLSVVSPSTTTAPVPGPVTTAPPVAAAPPAAAAACRTSGLTITLRPDRTAVELVNRGTAACTLTGQPAVTYVAGGRPVGAPAAPEGTPAPVTLAPQGRAAAALRIVAPTTVDRERCQSSPVEALRITPPGQSESVTVAAPGDTCADPSVVLITVGPVQAA